VRRALAAAVAVLVAACSAAPSASAPLNQRVFDKAWLVVGKRYWDRTMGGNDWAALRERFRPKAMAARDSGQLYDVINKMLDQLDDSHVYATGPDDLHRVREPEPGEDRFPDARRAVRLDGDILLLAFNQFDPGDERWIAAEMEAMPRLAGLILDLRRNGGGRDDILDKVAGLFTDRRELLIRLNGRSTIDERTRPSRKGAYTGPTAVIVGPNTASAAEILAFFLAESGRADSVGERTAGAVTGGVDYKLPDGGRLTVAEYDIRTANGTRLEGNGFTPRHRVSAATRPNDAALAKALALVRARQ